jgi:pilus assembly protein FimV
MAATAPASSAPAAVPQRVPPATGAAGGDELKSRVKSDKGAQSYGLTQRNDTLWSIATNLRPDDSVSVYQMMLALLKANPQAFYANNVNGLKAGYVLRVPDKSAVMAIDEAYAVREAARQYKLWQQSRRGTATTGEAEGATPADKSGQESQPTSTATQDKESARLRLVAPGDVSAKTGEGAGGTQEELDKLRGELAIAMESSDTAKRESDELRSRVSTLEDQINSMQRLLTLKDESLNELQKRSGMTATQPPAGSSTPAVAVPPAATVKPTPAKPAPAQPAAPKAKESLDLFADPTLMAAAGGAALLLLSVLWLVMRRRRNDEEVEPIESVEDQDVLPVAEDQPAQEEPAQEERMEIPDVAELGDTHEMTEVADEVAHDAEQDILEAAGDLDMLHTPEGDIDPIVEADVYLAYRRYQQAEALIQNALAKQPGSQDLQAKLLEIYYASKNAESFQKVAQSLYEGIGADDDNALWQRILPMGRELCPDHTLFNASGAAGGTAGKSATFEKQAGGIANALSGETLTGTAAGDEPLDLNIGDNSADTGSVEGGQAAADASQDEKMEFDLNLGEESLGGATDVAALGAAEQTSEPLQAESEFASQTSVAQAMEGAAETRQESAAEEGNQNKSWEIESATSDFSNIDFGLDDADLLAGTDVVGTKLDLARAYIDMGDNDSARDILTEVIEEGNDKQKQEAKGLVEKIA